MTSQLLRRVRRGATLAAVAAVSLAGLSACGSSEPRSLLGSIESGSVVLGTKFDQPALGLRNPDKSMTGFDVEVLKYVVNNIADTNGWEHPSIKWKESPSAQRETLIQNGEVDIIAATYSISATRAKKVDFAGPYLVIRQGLLVRAENESVNSLQDLQPGSKLCSVSGSTSAINVAAQLPDVQLQQYDTYSSCVEALHQKNVAALTTDETILAGFATQYPGEFKLVDMTYDKETCVKGSIKKAGAPFSTERYGIGLAKGDEASTVAINVALQEMIDSGVWEETLKREIGDDVVDGLIERAGSFEEFAPTPGDLSFLDSTSTPCEAS